jgi:hypothetical protein
MPSAYIYHNGMPGIPQISGEPGKLNAVLDACLSGFGQVTCDSLTQSGGVATLTRAAGLNFADGQFARRLIQVDGASGTNMAGYNGEKRAYNISATSCQFDCDPGLPATATGTITAQVAGCGAWWEKAFDGTNKAVYRSTGVDKTRLFLRLDDTQARYTLARGYEAMTDVDTGTGLFPTVAQLAAGQYWAKSNLASTATRPFLIVAMPGMLHVLIASHASLPQLCEWSAFGDIDSVQPGDAWHCICAGADSDGSAGGPGSTSNIARVDGFASAGFALARAWNQIGSAILPVRYGPWRFQQAVGDSGYGYSVAGSPSLRVRGPITVDDSAATPRGSLPGLYVPGHANPGTHLDLVENLTGLPGKSLLLARVGHGGQNRTILFDVTGAV